METTRRGSPGRERTVSASERACALAVAALAILGSVAPPPAAAQSVRGVLVEQGRGTPVEGAMVVLLAPGGRAVARVLTDAAGRYLVRAPASGPYTLRADRIGHGSVLSPVLDLAAGDTVRHDLTAPVQAVALQGIDVEGSRRCVVRPEVGLASARVWDEARKALEAAVWTADRGIYEYEILRFQRRLDTDARRVLEESREFSRLLQGRSPFVSVPAETLAREGYVRPDGDGFLYSAPDAEVLLSDSFLDTHCFRLRRGEGEARDLVGLEFEPVRGRRLPEIRGVLWIDPSTGQLHWLDFQYENLDLGFRTDRAGGRVAFQGLPNGTWIVRDWTIRMPLRGVVPGRGRREHLVLAGFLEEGSTTVRILEPDGRLVLEADAGVVAGVVLDSLGVPLPGAHVRTGGGAVEDTSADDGSFRLAGLAGGTYDITFSHAALDSVGFQAPPVEVVAAPGETASVRLQAPSRWDILARGCRDEPRPEGTTTVAGRVRDAAGTPLGGATVRVLWSEWTLGTLRHGPDRDRPADIAAGMRSRPLGGRFWATFGEGREGLEQQVREDGFFLFCAVPWSHPLTAEVEPAGAEDAPRAGGAAPAFTVELRAPADRRVWLVDLAPASSPPPRGPDGGRPPRALGSLTP